MSAGLSVLTSGQLCPRPHRSPGDPVWQKTRPLLGRWFVARSSAVFGGRVDQCSGGRDVRCRWNRCAARVSDVAETSPLIARKEKRAVFEDRSPDRSAELVSL